MAEGDHYIDTTHLDEGEREAIQIARESLAKDVESPFLNLALVTAAVALDRWGRDLNRTENEQRYGGYQQVLLEIADEMLLESGEKIETSQPGEWVIDDFAVDIEGLVMMADQLTELIESECNIERHQPGGLAQKVDIE